MNQIERDCVLFECRSKADGSKVLCDNRTFNPEIHERVVPEEAPAAEPPAA